MTVEMATVFPIFLIAMLTILMFSQIFMADQEIHRSMVECARELALSSKPEETIITAKAHWLKHVDKDYINHSCVKKGTKGVSFFGSYYNADRGEIILKVRYEAGIPFLLFKKLNWKSGYEIRQKVFRGYEPELEGEEDPWVYITENQSVYHIGRNCSHLCLKIHQVFQKEKYFNGKTGYTPCEFCIRKRRQMKGLYITEQGTKYHSTLTCSGLKRSIHRIRKSEIKGLRPCSRCGGKCNNEKE